VLELKVVTLHLSPPKYRIQVRQCTGCWIVIGGQLGCWMITPEKEPVPGLYNIGMAYQLLLLLIIGPVMVVSVVLVKEILLCLPGPRRLP
jgi:hypothetical protein